MTLTTSASHNHVCCNSCYVISRTVVHLHHVLLYTNTVPLCHEGQDGFWQQMDALQLPINEKVIKIVAKTVATWHVYTATRHRKYTQLVNSKTIQDSEVRILYTVKPVRRTVSKFVDLFVTNMILHHTVHYQSILMYNLLFRLVQFSTRSESTQSELLSYFPDFSVQSQQ